MLSTARGSLATSSMQKPSALRLLLLSQRHGDPPFTPSWWPLSYPWHLSPASPDHKARLPTASRDSCFFIEHFRGVGLWVGRSWKHSLRFRGEWGGTLRKVKDVGVARQMWGGGRGAGRRGVSAAPPGGGACTRRRSFSFRLRGFHPARPSSLRFWEEELLW